MIQEIIRTCYKTILPLSLRRVIGQMDVYKWGKLLSAKRYGKKLVADFDFGKQTAVWQSLLREERPIRVAFQLDTMGKWKADSLLLLMQNHPRFEPVIWFLDYRYDSDKQFALVEKHFAGTKVPIVRYTHKAAFPAEERPDIVFISEGYDWRDLYAKYNEGLTDGLFCYMPYAMISVYGKEGHDNALQNLALFCFYEHEEAVRRLSRVMRNGGRNLKATGSVTADNFLTPARPHDRAWKNCGEGKHKRIIYAPHWTIRPGANRGDWLRSGTFLKTGEMMLELAKEHAHDIQFAFKPHPSLYRNLCADPDWGKEKTDAYYKAWAELPNCQLEEGEYAALFMQSDGCIHDCFSFIQEYLYADKPCCFLREGAGFRGYSDIIHEAFASYAKASTKEEIEAFLQSVLRGEDPHCEARRTYREKYLLPKNGKTTAQNIVNCLLGEDEPS